MVFIFCSGSDKSVKNICLGFSLARSCFLLIFCNWPHQINLGFILIQKIQTCTFSQFGCKLQTVRNICSIVVWCLSGDLVAKVDTVCHRLFMRLSHLLPCPPLSSGCRHKWLVKEMFWTLERSSQLIGGHTTLFLSFNRLFFKAV